ncbi:MAG: UrcA family protein [Alphaproteobacteria bacterium]|nr:UrcA family protein [Alphaproteobacteria bacterium]
MIRTALIALASLAVVGLAGTAAADERVGSAPAERVAPVRQNDLDLSSERGASIMLQRLRRAADAVCDAPELYNPTAATRRAMAACRNEALNEAVRLLAAPAVTRLHVAGETSTVSYTR